MATDPTGRISHIADMHRGLTWKPAVRCATTANITISTALNNGDTLDGITLATGDRVLVKNQSTASQNGIYIVGATPTRAADMDQDLTTAVPAEEIAGSVVFVIAGTANASTIWYTTNVGGGTIGSTSIAWTQFTSGGVTGFATPAIVLGTAAAAGAATTVIRSDATIVAFDATVPVTQALGDSAATGSAAKAARRDHKHAMPTAAVTTSGLTQAAAKLLGRTTAATGAIEEISVGTGLSLSAGSLSATGGGGGDTSGVIGAGYDGGLSVLVATKDQDVIAPYAGTITSWEIVGDVSGSAAFDILKSTYAGFPGSLSSIVAAAAPSVSGAQKATSSTLTGWSTSISAGDVLRFRLGSVSTFQRLLLILNYSRP